MSNEDANIEPPKQPNQEAAGTDPQVIGDAIDMEKTSFGEATSTLLRLFNYSASLPERTFRSASACRRLCTRISQLVGSFRLSQFEILFDLRSANPGISDQRYRWRSQSLTAGSERHQQEVVLARKTVGNLLDMTALATFHLSPLTVLAIFSDAAYGSKVYLEQLSSRLKEQGIIDQNTTIDGAADLITAIEAASGKAAVCSTSRRYPSKVSARPSTTFSLLSKKSIPRRFCPTQKSINFGDKSNWPPKSRTLHFGTCQQRFQSSR